MPSQLSLPEVQFVGDLFCPHCGTRLFSADEGSGGKCPHVVFGYGRGFDPDVFLSVRADFARSFMNELLESSAYHECLSEDEMEPISRKDQEEFSRAEFRPEDRVACLIAEYCRDFPDKMFPELLLEETVIFKAEKTHSSVRFAVDLGARQNVDI